MCQGVSNPWTTSRSGVLGPSMAWLLGCSRVPAPGLWPQPALHRAGGNVLIAGRLCLVTCCQLSLGLGDPQQPQSPGSWVPAAQHEPLPLRSQRSLALGTGLPQALVDQSGMGEEKLQTHFFAIYETGMAVRPQPQAQPTTAGVGPCRWQKPKLSCPQRPPGVRTSGESGSAAERDPDNVGHRCHREDQSQHWNWSPSWNTVTAHMTRGHC